MKNPQARPDLRSSSHSETSSLIAFGAVVLIIASLYWAQSVLIPIALSIMLTFLLSPVATALERTGLGRLPSIILIVLLTFSLLATVGWVVAIEFTSLGNELPKYTDNIRQKISDVRGAGKGGALENVQKAIDQVKEEIQKKEEPRTNKEKPSQVIVQPQESSRFWPIPLVSTAMLEPLAAAGLVIVLVVFMLVQREDLRNRLIRLVGYGRLTVTTQAMEEAGQRISRYLLMQTIVNSSFGLAVGLGLYFIGLPYAIVWGFLATVLRFIPYVGTFAATIMPTALSLAVFQGWLWPIFVVGLFSFLELLNNMVLEPLLYSESAGVSGVGLLVAIAFWTWLWGPVGLVLATPLTVCVVVLAKYVPWLDFIGVLMSDQPAMESNISYYQRLVAMDQAEAAEIAEEHLKNHPRELIFDAVLIPALSYARRDRELGRLTEDGEQFVFRATREIVEDLNSLMPESSPATPDSVKTATIVENNPVIPLKNCVLGCPARDEADEVALHMLTQLFDSTRYEVEVISDALLTSEVVGLIADRSPAVVLIATVSRGGMTHARYLCKRLRARFPHLKIVIGRWGLGSEDSNSVALAGADRVGTTLIETRDQIIRLSQISLDPDAPQTVPSLSPLDSDVFAEASASI
jgi:predicted PurR-regulated permease PerM